MTAADEWRDLARRCREAPGPDREINLALARSIDAVVMWQKDGCAAQEYTHWHFTGSIDDIVTLIEKTLPGYDWRVGKCPIDGADKYDAQLYHEDDAKDTDADASSPALALCAAYCEARAAVEDAA